MTMKVTEHKVTTARKKHPNDGRYPCRSSQELLHAGLKLMSNLDPISQEKMRTNDLIIDEEETAELYDAIEVNDIIGLGILRENGFKSNKYEVIKIVEGEDFMICKNLYTELEEEISFQDISVGFALGFAEILYREEKPFGVSAEIEYTIKIHSEEKEEEKDGNTEGEKTMASELDEMESSNSSGETTGDAESNTSATTEAEETT